MGHAQSRKLRGGPRLSRTKQLSDAYVANPVSLKVISAFVHSNGGGGQAFAWVAGRQLNVIDVRQLQAVGLGRGAIATRRASGLLTARHRGVYLVGPGPALPGALELAALLACGSGSVISHRSAAALWGLAKRRGDAIDVTVVGRECRRSDGTLALRNTQALHPADRTTLNGLRVTAPARTLIDFAAVAEADELESAVSEAFALKLVTEPKLHAAMARAPHRAGVGALRALLASTGGPVVSRSEAERRLRKLLAAARLPTPLFNAPLYDYEVDVLWPDHRLVVEFDGFNVHGHRLAFERDRRRDATLVAAGYRVIRLTWNQLTREPFAVVATLARALIA